MTVVNAGKADPFLDPVRGMGVSANPTSQIPNPKFPGLPREGLLAPACPLPPVVYFSGLGSSDE